MNHDRGLQEGPSSQRRGAQGATTESSVLVTLKELMGLEECRVAEEHEAERARVERAEVARREAAALEERRRAEDERAEAEKRAVAERVAREEQVRLEALRAATVERAKLDALGKARVEELKLAQDHEHRLAELSADRDKRRLRRGLISLVCAFVCVVGAALGIYLGKIRPDSLREEERIRQETAQVEAENARLARERADAQQRLDDLAHERSQIPTSVAIDKPDVKPQPHPIETHWAKPPPPPPPQPKCDPKDRDPINGCI
jgi:colicin import membrane protein